MGKQDTATSGGQDRARDERLARALRENLRRRKAQARNRDEGTRPAGPGARVPIDKESKQP